MKTGRYIPYEDVVYRLDGYVIDDIDEASYPVFDVYHQEEILFHSLEEAEKKIEELAKEESKTDIVSLFDRCLSVFIAIIRDLSALVLILATVNCLQRAWRLKLMTQMVFGRFSWVGTNANCSFVLAIW